MPYLSPEERRSIDGQSVEMAGWYGGRRHKAGMLNYVLTRAIRGYVKGAGLNYQTINDVVGALDGAKVEFQRRVVAPYEDTKIEQNGDVYE